MSTLATAADEVPAFLPAGSESLFAVLTTPTTEPNGIAVVITSGGHWTTTIGTNRLYVRLARELAGHGFHTVRFDYLGVGESSGPTRAYRLDDLFTGDAEAVVAWLRTRGINRFVFVGACYGARIAVDVAGRMDGVIGMALAPAIVRDYEHGQRVESLPLPVLIRRALRTRTLAALRSPEQRQRYGRILRRRLRRLRGGQRPAAGASNGFEWVSPLFLASFERAVDQRIPVLFVFGRDEDFYGDFRRGQSGRLGELLRKAGPLARVVETDGMTHGLNTIGVQDEVMAAITDWLRELART